PEQQDSLLQWAHTQLQVDSAQFMLSYLKMKPFVLVQLATQKELVDKTKSYDMTIQQMANEQKISTVGLETVAEQMAIFDNMDTLTQRNMVMEFIRHPEGQLEQLEKMYAIYLQQNVDAMFQFIDEDKSSMMDAQNELLDERNQKWIPKIETLIKSKRTFIAVGAGHLGGKNGVLRLLEKKGYKLTPIHL
ncbi:MAG TPA: TraB/GumN family protein, partial [Taishania sp.]|nr:TraB/GumN family protein [Taishania sp.]